MESLSQSNSISLLNKHISITTDGCLDVSGIISKQCFNEWLQTKAKRPQFPEHAFRKIVSGHCRGDLGLAPFAPVVEKAVLKLLRQKKVWPCFADTKFRIGIRGFQKKGYWENRLRKREELENSSSRESSASLVNDLATEIEYNAKFLNSLKEKYKKM